MDLRCNETAQFEEEGDIGMEGIKSFADPALVSDHRVLNNVLARSWNQGKVPDYFANVQKNLKPHMRKIVVGWMMDVTEEQLCHPEVFALSVNYLDRVLSQVEIHKNQFQLLAAVCIFLASKFKETNPLCAEKLVVYSDFSITTHEITQWELMVLQVLNWDLSSVTPYCIADQLLRRLNLGSFDRAQARHYTENLIALAASDHSLQVEYSPVLIAVSSLATSLSRMSQHQEQDNFLRNFLDQLCAKTGLLLPEVVHCVNRLEDIIAKNNPATFQPPAPKLAKHSHGCPFPGNSSSNLMTNSFSGNSNFCNNAVSITPTDMVDISTTYVY